MRPEEVVLHAVTVNWGAASPRSMTDKLLTALSTAGFVVVPREPTEAMIAACPKQYVYDATLGFTPTLGGDGPSCYKAMLSAYEEDKS